MPSSAIENTYKLASLFQFFYCEARRRRCLFRLGLSCFCEGIQGLYVIDKVVQVETDDGDWPLQNIYLKKVEIIE
jgi:peptidyl-prolyl cis-trans isomerase A (cyclophilin A)